MREKVKIYQQNIQRYEDEGKKWSRLSDRMAISRVVTFLIAVVLIIYLANERQGVLLLVVAPICVATYLYLVKRSNRILYRKRHATYLREINEAELSKLENRLDGLDAGEVFLNRNHPYASDLDIFGSHSLFQLLNRSTTESGRALLASWMSHPASKAEIERRQEAIKELGSILEWRQDFQASGMHFKNTKSDYNKLLGWIEKPVALLPNKSRYLLACIFLSLLSTSSAIYYSIHAFTSDSMVYIIPLLIFLYINSRVLKSVAPLAEEMIDCTHENVKILGGYVSLITKIESEKFHAVILQRLQSTLNYNNHSARKEINKLKKILEMFQLRGTKRSMGNFFYPIFNILWLFDIHGILITEKWKYRNSSYLRGWASAVSEFETLNSIAGFSYSNPSYTFPEIEKEPYIIHFETLGHPLIHPGKRICNDFYMEERGTIAMVTGSNMAGKSTFLRTVGANIVLALMGAPCCAKSGCVSEMEVFSSMRTQDNLETGVSSFYAELQRIEQLLGLIKKEKPIFFLLDEMFKGTNSEDRHKGGFSLIRQLAGLNAFGIISTHDLELAKLSGKHGLVKNYSFNSEIKNAEIFFDYKLCPEICRDFNASELMKRSGIEIIEDFGE